MSAPAALPPAAPPSRRWIRLEHLLTLSLVLGILLLLFNIYLLLLLRSLDEQARTALARVALAEAALGRAADAIERGPIEVPIRLQAELPIRTTIRLQETVQFPVRTEVPINANLELPINTPLGSFSVPVPVNVNVPVNTVVPVAIDQSIPISATVPVDIDRPIQIDLRGTELGAELRRFRQALQSGG